MANHDFTRSGVLRGGFQYQDLVAIEILIDYYADANLYDWVQLDAEDSEYQSIDDVVARRPDKRYELTQVKFAADPDSRASKLSWTWLTKRNGARRSLLQKWSKTTLQHARAEKLEKAVLKTDRIPDDEFARCLDLDGRRVIYGRLTTDVRSTVDEHVGSSNDARLFFESFEFEHSKPRLDDLKNQLWSRVAPHTDSGGWATFRLRVQSWSTHKNRPGPDGKIRYAHLRQAFAVQRGSPIPQDFQIPDSYRIPDQGFHEAFFQEICGSDGITVLWGPPGRGKSTYLSHCVSAIDRARAVCIRHHYFMSVKDRYEYRFSYHAIVQSLVHQLQQSIPELTSSSQLPLGQLLQSAADRLKVEGRRLIVIVDGLDHVWRDNRDQEVMELLFESLVPVQENVRLVVGTQKIDSAHLPSKLVSAIPHEQWTELPSMSLAAVNGWITFQDKADKLNLTVPKWQTREQAVGRAAIAFHEVTQGLPLHLIYSFETLAHSGDAATEENIAALPACPTGDIQDYYRALWERIGANAQAILHVLAGLRFGPPPFALSHCFRRNGSLEAMNEIAHLLDYRETEVQPFHSSLFAFVRELSDHEQLFREHVVDTVNWLEKEAPDVWRWAWLWITKAQLGHASELLAGPDRDWAIRSLVCGFPIEQIVNILNHSETVALDALDLPRLLSLRSLKTRAINGPEYQTHDWPLFLEVAASLSEDPFLLRLLRSRLGNAPASFLPYMVRSADRLDRPELAREAISELKRRIARTLGDAAGTIGDEHALVADIVAVAANNLLEDPDRVIAYALQASGSDAESLIDRYAREALLASNFDHLFTVAERNSGWRADRDVLAALCCEGLAPSAKPKLKANSHPAVRCLALLHGEEANASQTERDLSHLFVDADPPAPEKEWAVQATVYEMFFSALSEALSGKVGAGWSTMPADAEESWLGKAVRAMEQLADHIALEWKQSEHWPTLGEFYRRIDLNPPVSNSYDEKRALRNVRFAIRDIAVDIATIAKGLDSNALIDASDIRAVVESAYWDDELWLWGLADRRLPFRTHTKSAAQAYLERVGDLLDNTITRFGERSTFAAQLAFFAFDHGLSALAKKELRRAIGCVLGYGSYEDPFALEVLESLDLLANRGDAKARETLLKLAGEFEALTTCTEEDIGRPRERYYKAVFAQYQEKIPACYTQLIRGGEWYFAELLALEIVNIRGLESGAGRALLKSYILPSEIQAMEETDRSTRPHLNKALASVYQKTGRLHDTTRARNGNRLAVSGDSNASVTKSEGMVSTGPAPAEYPPDALEDFLKAIADIRGYIASGQLVTAWLRHWENAGRAEAALSSLDALVSRKGHYFGLEAAMDTAFQIALTNQGRSKAFPWLVRAQIANGGWKRWYSSGEAAKVRFQQVSKHYPDRWQEFIRHSAMSLYPSRIEEGAGVVGQFRLVEFLVEVGQMDAARDCALELARIFEEEFSDQPIRSPEWSK